MNIREVAKQFNLTTDTIRYYERIGLIPKITRNSSGYRDFTEEEIDILGYVKCMRDAGASVESLIEYFHLYQEGEKTIEARKQILCEQQVMIKEKLDELQVTYDKITEKVENYETHILAVEKKMSEIINDKKERGKAYASNYI